MKAVSVKQVRELDRRTIEGYGTPGVVLMERAGIRAAEAILEWTTGFPGKHVKRFVFLAGKGNNGGDAYVAAKHIHEKYGVSAIVYTVCPVKELQGDALCHAGLLPDTVPVVVKENLLTDDFLPGDVIVDGLLGTGISGPLRAPYDQWIKAVNNSGLPVAALDIPSGMNGDTGDFEADCVMADLTVTIGLPKYGLVRGTGPDYCGLLRLVEIGIPDNYVEEAESDLDIYFEQDAQDFLVRIPMQSYKNSVGRVLVCGGCDRYRGAPLLAAESAMRGGAGMVYMLTAGKTGAQRVPKALISQNVGTAFLDESSIPVMEQMARHADVIVCGPGLDRRPGSDFFVQACGSVGLHVVYDADALALISQNISLLVNEGKSILTPHPGEMRMLLEGFDLEHLLDASRQQQALGLAEAANSIVVLKGRNTVVADSQGRVVVNSSGSPALSGAGSGDCLSGLIGAFVSAQHGRSNVFEATCAAVFIHGLSGELNPCGVRGAIADDLPELIAAAMLQVSALA